jgi:hypothetical protein
VTLELGEHLLLICADLSSQVASLCRVAFVEIVKELIALGRKLPAKLGRALDEYQDDEFGAFQFPAEPTHVISRQTGVSCQLHGVREPHALNSPKHDMSAASRLDHSRLYSRVGFLCCRSVKVCNLQV